MNTGIHSLLALLFTLALAHAQIEAGPAGRTNAWAATAKKPAIAAPVEKDPRVQANGKQWRLDKATGAGRRVVEPGKFFVMVGAASADIRLQGEFSVAPVP